VGAVSVNTAETHLPIHRKLGVEGPREAVEGGRRRGLP
jgi:hypothetical protein